MLSAAQKAGKDVAIFQLEMSDMQLTTRMISSEALVDSRKLRMGTLDDNDWDKIAHASAPVSYTHLDVYKRQVLPWVSTASTSWRLQRNSTSVQRMTAIW